MPLLVNRGARQRRRGVIPGPPPGPPADHPEIAWMSTDTQTVTHSGGWSGNAFDVVASVTYTHSDGVTSHTTEMYHVGSSQWSWRFTGTKLGVWTYTTSSDEGSLNNLSGTIRVVEAGANTMGFLRPSGEALVRATSNGTSSTPVVYNVYEDRPRMNDLSDLNEAEVERSLELADIFDNLENNGKFALHVKLYHNVLDFGSQSYEDHSSEEPDLFTFGVIEEILSEARDRGMMVHFWMWGDEATRKWTPIGLSGGINGSIDQRLQRYICARLGPLPGWTMSYGFDLGEWVSESELRTWRDFMEDHLGYEHLLTAREHGPDPAIDLGSDGFDLYSTDDRPETDFHLTALDRLDDHNKPVLFERRFHYLRDGVWSSTVTIRVLWQWATIGGAGAIWGNDGGGYYPSQTQNELQIFDEFWRNYAISSFVRVQTSGGYVATRTSAADRYIVYETGTSSVELPLADLDQSRPAIAVDTRAASYSEVDLGTLSPGTQTWTAPHTSDWVVVVGTGETTSVYLETVAQSADDSEEVLDPADGRRFVDSADLELGEDNDAGAMAVGVRWQNIPIPQGGTVNSASIRFTSSEGGQPGGLTVRIWAEASNNATAFADVAEDISGRSKTSQFVDWDVPAWSGDQNDDDTTTPDLSALVQEVVDRPGWNQGNAIAFIIETSPNNTVANPRAAAHAFDNLTDSGLAPELALNQDHDSTQPAVVSGFSTDGLDRYDLTMNEGFDANNPTLKDGTPIEGDMLTYYEAVVAWAQNPGGSNQSDPTVQLPHSDVYQSARSGMNCQQAVSHCFRLTGDPRLLDLLTGWFIDVKNSMVTEWSGYDQSDYEDAVSGACFSDDPWAPFDKKLRTSGSFWGTGTDGHIMNEERFGGMAAEVAWMLHVNRGKTSPAGHNYATEADYWKTFVENFIKKWSQDTGACWEDNYLGTNWGNTSRHRASPGEWPVCADASDSHSTWCLFAFHHYAEALRANASADIPTGADDFVDELFTDLAGGYFTDCTSSYGDSYIWGHRWMPQHSDDREQRMTYVGYETWSMQLIWLMGLRRDVFTSDMLLKVARTLADNLNSDGSMEGHLGGGLSSLCGLSDFSTGDLSASNVANKNPIGVMIWEDPSDNRLSTIGLQVQQNEGGGLNSPDSALIAASLFLKEALTEIGDV